MPQNHTLYYATNRRHVGRDRWRPSRYSGEYSKDGVENLRFGKVMLQLDRSRMSECLHQESGFGTGNGEALAKHAKSRRRTARIEAFTEVLPKDESDTRQDGASFGSSLMFQELRQAPLADRDILVFVHGFNVDWWDAVASATSLELMLNRNRDRKVAVVLFTWPSDGKIIPYWSYFSDRADARSSGYAVGRGFLKLRDFLVEQLRRSHTAREEPCERSVHLLCHSMGNYVLQSALQRTLEFSTSGRPPRVFDQIFLCAPDVADDVFEPGRPFCELPGMAENVTVYHNKGDLAMPVSDYTKGNTDRLGWRGANRPADLDGRVHIVDCSATVTGLVEHGYYQCGRVNDDIAQSLDGIRPEDDSRRRIAVQHGWPNVWRLQ